VADIVKVVMLVMVRYFVDLKCSFGTNISSSGIGSIIGRSLDFRWRYDFSFLTQIIIC
jgi:hypothetical protein